MKHDDSKFRAFKKKIRKRKLQGTEFYDNLETFPSQSKEEGKVVALISYGLVEQYYNIKLSQVSRCFLFHDFYYLFYSHYSLFIF